MRFTLASRAGEHEHALSGQGSILSYQVTHRSRFASCPTQPVAFELLRSGLVRTFGRLARFLLAVELCPSRLLYPLKRSVQCIEVRKDVPHEVAAQAFSEL